MTISVRISPVKMHNIPGKSIWHHRWKYKRTKEQGHHWHLLWMEEILYSVYIMYISCILSNVRYIIILCAKMRALSVCLYIKYLVKLNSFLVLNTNYISKNIIQIIFSCPHHDESVSVIILKWSLWTSGGPRDPFWRSTGSKLFS